MNKKARDNDKSGVSNQPTREMAPQGVPGYVPVSKSTSTAPIAFIQVPVPPVSSIMVSAPIQVSVPPLVFAPATSSATALMTMAFVAPPASTQLLTTFTTSLVTASTIVTVCAGLLFALISVTTQPLATTFTQVRALELPYSQPLVATFAPVSAYVSPTTVPGSYIPAFSHSIPAYIPYGVSPTIGYYPGNYGVMTPAYLPVYDPSLGTVAFNYQIDEMPSNRSFLGRHRTTQSERSVPSEYELDGENFGSFYGSREKNDGFPSEDEPLRDNDCIREFIQVHFGSGIAADYIENSLNDDGFQNVSRRSDRLKSKKVKGLNVRFTITGRPKRR